MRNQDEFRLACVVSDYLERTLPTRAIWTHFPAGENRNEKTGARLKRMGLKRGWPDYLILFDKLLIGIELKAGKGKVSDAQADVADSFTANGAAWSVVRSTEELEAFLMGLGVPLRARIAA